MTADLQHWAKFIAILLPIALVFGGWTWLWTMIAKGAKASYDEHRRVRSLPPDSAWRPPMTHRAERAAFTALTEAPRPTWDEREITIPIYPFAAERERVIRERRQKGVQ